MNKLKNILTLIKGKLSKGINWYKSLYRNAPWYKKVGVGFATFIVSIILFLGAVDINFLWLFGKSPGFSEIRNPKTNDASLSKFSSPVVSSYRPKFNVTASSPVMVRKAM